MLLDITAGMVKILEETISAYNRYIKILTAKSQIEIVQLFLGVSISLYRRNLSAYYSINFFLFSVFHFGSRATKRETESTLSIFRFSF